MTLQKTVKTANQPTQVSSRFTVAEIYSSVFIRPGANERRPFARARICLITNALPCLPTKEFQISHFITQ